ncbi:MAG: hypothetical protein JWM76_2980 [Pseudonocardiales bacterium]|nr:hypothetical protein [Pseudonocardiales bacterium]
MGEPDGDSVKDGAAVGDSEDGFEDVLSRLPGLHSGWGTSPADRDRTADERDHQADQRDRRADERDASAQQREGQAIQREQDAAQMARAAHRRLNAARDSDADRWAQAANGIDQPDDGTAFDYPAGAASLSSPGSKPVRSDDRIAELMEKGIERDNTRADLRHIAQQLGAAATERRTAAADRVAAATDRSAARADRDEARTAREQAALDRAPDDTDYVS